ncbi:MAG TPA: hypothetical protein VK082_08730 [Paenalcaligenes sp.]|nr:hypothetical protein [Paenalcaligenes sp.]
MSTFSRVVILFILAVITILIAIILGDYGPWYLAWLLGTGFMVLVAAMGGVLFEDQESELIQREGFDEVPPKDE